MGGLRQRHPGGRRRRHHHPGRHAAQLAPPTLDAAGLKAKRAAAEGRVHVDVGFWGGAVPGNLADLPALHDAGVLGFKCFLLPSGVEEFPPLDGAGLARCLEVLAGLGALLLVHAEDAATVALAPAPTGRGYAGFLRSQPPEAETLAVARVVEAGRAAGARVHVLHLSSADALATLAAARRDGVAVSAETCPHYLTFDAESMPDGATQFKCCPPIREAANRERLWRGLAGGLIDLVASDHSPCPPDLKHLEDGDFGAAWGGIASLQLSLPAVWTAVHLPRRRGGAAAGPRRARRQGLGRIAAGRGRGGPPGRAGHLLVRRQRPGWVELLPRTRLLPDTRHRLRVDGRAEVTHVRLDVFRDGGMARLRLHGQLAPAAARAELALRFVNLLPADHARQVLAGDGGLAGPELERLVAARPLGDLAALPDRLAARLTG